MMTYTWDLLVENYIDQKIFQTCDKCDIKLISSDIKMHVTSTDQVYSYLEQKCTLDLFPDADLTFKLQIDEPNKRHNETRIMLSCDLVDKENLFKSTLNLFFEKIDSDIEITDEMLGEVPEEFNKYNKITQYIMNSVFPAISNAYIKTNMLMENQMCVIDFTKSFGADSKIVEYVGGRLPQFVNIKGEK